MVFLCLSHCVHVQLTGTLGQHEAQWREESSELSHHYSALLREAEQRTRVSWWVEKGERGGDM